VVHGVGMSVESDLLTRSEGLSSLQVRMLGPFSVSRNDIKLPLAASRKVRALFAYLALAPHPVPRRQLCELLWELPNDPRGELRWCLSKIRRVVDEPRRRRVESHADAVRLDLSDCFVDAIEVARATGPIEGIASEQLRALAALFAGDVLDGLEMEGSAAFNGWLVAQRRRFRACQAAVLEHLARSAPEDEVLRYLERWLELAPFDLRVHELVFTTLAGRDQIREGEEHLAATTRSFDAEGLDCAPLCEAWRSARAQRESSPSAASNDAPIVAARRASVAVMPFVDASPVTGVRGGIADALADDVITRLAKLRSLFVIAQGTVFALHERHVDPEEAGRLLNVEYVAGGSVRRQGQDLHVTVELAETRSARIIWAEVFNH
jgi:DNA-binding SARP family transcriptional activator